MVKNHQPTLAAAIEHGFDSARATGYQKLPHTVAEWVEQDHGRSETRRCVVMTDLSPLGGLRHDWPGLKALVMVEARRDLLGLVSTERRYYLSSRLADAATLGSAVRGHWGIETKLHWSLDVTFGEDQSRMRAGNAAENFSVLRRIALNLFRQDHAVKAGVKTRRLLACADDAYRQKLLGLQLVA